jgi:hypothetical protein
MANSEERDSEDLDIARGIGERFGEALLNWDDPGLHDFEYATKFAEGPAIEPGRNFMQAALGLL